MLSLKEFNDVTMKGAILKINGFHNKYDILCLKTAVEMCSSQHDVDEHIINAIITLNSNNGDYFKFLANSIVELLKKGAQLDVKKDYDFYKTLEPMMKDYATKNCIKDFDAAVLMNTACQCGGYSKQVDEWSDDFNKRYFKGHVFNIAGTDYITNRGFQLVKNVVESINKDKYDA